MAIYAQLSDATDPLVVPEEGDMEKADQLVASTLRQQGIQPSDVPLPHPLLRDLAVYYATYLAAVRGQATEDGVMERKITHYQRLYTATQKLISRASLGLDSANGSAGGGIGSVLLERG